MSRMRRLRADLTIPIEVLAVLTVLVAGWAAVGNLRSLAGPTLLHLGLFLGAIALGETARLAILTGRETAPMSTAAALGLSLAQIAPKGTPTVSAAAVIATISAGMLLGGVILTIAGRSPQWPDMAARLVGVAVAPVLYRWVPFNGQTLLQWQQDWGHERWLTGLVMVLVASVAMAVELFLEAAIRAGRDHSPLWRTAVDEIRTAAGMSTALVTSGTLIALAEYAIGVVALPLFLFPLLLTYFAVQRYASVRATYRQTIGALSSLTDRAGYTAQNHAQRVTATALAVGRDLGMGQRELTDLEYAAMLHDLGQVALREPIPGGATVMAAPADQQRIAHDGAEIVRTTGVLDNVAEILEAQTTPYRQVREFGQDLPMASRIIKVTNAYDDLCGAGGNDERAMERIHLGLGYEYDPRVVDSLSRVLERRRRTAPSSAG